VVLWASRGLYAIAVLITVVPLAVWYAGDPSRFFGDAALYWEATAAWLRGGDPWAITGEGGLRFAGIPPTLLLNLPLQPLGPDVARVVWGVGDLVAWAFVLRRTRASVWLILFPPYWEAWFPGNPDPVLLAFILLGAGAIAALTKPYSIPAMLGDGRWRAVLLGAGALVATVPLLPWGLYLDALPRVSDALESQAHHTSAFGDWPLFVAAALALLSLGRRRGLELAVPALWPAAQLHYSLFSFEAARSSAVLALVLAVPKFAAPGVIVYAVVIHAARLHARWRRSRA
jgi:hypothetical protein